MNRGCLSALRRQAEMHKERALVVWYSTVESADRFVSLSNVRLLVVTGNTVYLLPGTVSRTPEGDQQLLFAAKGLCRIRNGRRRGMIIEPCRLRLGEDADNTGLVKPLACRSKTNSFRMTDDRDRAVVERLYTAYADAVELAEIVLPEAYIRSRSSDNLVMRLSGDVSKQLMDLPDYDRALAMEDNFHNLIGSFTIKDGGSQLYPLHMVQGTGLVVMDTESFPPPLLVPQKAVTAEHKLLKVTI